MKTQFYKFIISHIAICFLGTAFAQKVENTISVSDIVAKLKQLKEKYRLVVSLYLIEGYDHQEIATILNISENTSRTHLLRGRKLLKEALKNNSYATRH